VALSALTGLHLGRILAVVILATVALSLLGVHVRATRLALLWR
jgi:hypothetical protein